MSTPATLAGTFYGWRVVAAAFVLAVFGWGVGFFGPPVFLQCRARSAGWPLVLVSTAVSLHFLVGAVTGASLLACIGVSAPRPLRRPARSPWLPASSAGPP